MKTITTILFILLSSYWSFAQVCGTPHPQNPRIYSGTETASARSGGTVFCIEKYYSLLKNNVLNINKTINYYILYLFSRKVKKD